MTSTMVGAKIFKYEFCRTILEILENYLKITRAARRCSSASTPDQQSHPWIFRGFVPHAHQRPGSTFVMCSEAAPPCQQKTFISKYQHCLIYKGRLVRSMLTALESKYLIMPSNAGQCDCILIHH